MKLTNHLSQLLQKETDKALKDIIGENPDLLKKYVDGGLTAVSLALAPINAFMRHLLVVQGLDPDTSPGEKNRALISQAMDALFQKTHEKDFEDDYDVSWVHNKFGAVQNKLNITKDKFMALTDLSRVDNTTPPDLSKMKIDELIQVVNPETIPAEKRELPMGVTVDATGVMTYHQDAIQRLREAAEKIKAERITPELGQKTLELEPKSKKKKSGQKTLGLKVGKKKLNKKSGPGPKVQRVTPTFLEQQEKDYLLKEEASTTLTVQADRKNHTPSRDRLPNRSISDLAAQRKAAAKAAEEATEEFKAEAASRLTRATALTHLMAQKGIIEDTIAARDNQIESMRNWSDNNFDALERVVKKFSPTRNAPVEEKFKGSFRRTER